MASRMNMLNRMYIIAGMTLAEAKAALEKALGICFDERDSSWYASLYYLCEIDKDHRLKLTTNQDFEGEPIEDNAGPADLLLEAGSSGPDDPLLSTLDKLSFLVRLN
jgi:hypothetical protein